MIAEGERGPLEGSMKPLTLMASEESLRTGNKRKGAAGMGTDRVISWGAAAL